MSYIDDALLGRDQALEFASKLAPALYEPWVSEAAENAGIAQGQDVLDVGCRVGSLAYECKGRTGSAGHVVGIDPDNDMLVRARTLDQSIEWQQSHLEKLPFKSGTFDKAVSFFGLHLSRDPRATIREMWRVVRVDGRVSVIVWDGLDRIPPYAALMSVVTRLFGRTAADALSAPFQFGSTDTLMDLFRASGIRRVRLRPRINNLVRFKSLDDWLDYEVAGHLLRDEIGPDALVELKNEAAMKCASFIENDGTFQFNMPAHLAAATKH